MLFRSLAQGAVPDEQWSRLVASLKRKRGKRFSLDGLLNSARTHTIEGGQLVIGYPSRSNMERLQQELEHPNVRKTLADAVEHALGTRLDISPVLLTQDEGPQQRGHLVRAAQRMGGRVVAEEAITSEDES